MFKQSTVSKLSCLSFIVCVVCLSIGMPIQSGCLFLRRLALSTSAIKLTLGWNDSCQYTIFKLVFILKTIHHLKNFYRKEIIIKYRSLICNSEIFTSDVHLLII